MNDRVPAPETRMTLRDHFASLVTGEPASWFRNVPLTGRPQRPKAYNQIEPPKDLNQDEFKQWESRRDAHEQSEEYAREWQEYEAANEKYIEQNALSRLVQWKYAVADAMLAERMTVREGSPRAA